MNNSASKPLGFRALTEFRSLGPNQKNFAITNDDSTPHLREGEFAVVDLHDREAQHGVIRYDTGDQQIVETKFRGVYWWCCDLAGFRKSETTIKGIPEFRGVADGPYERTEHTDAILDRLWRRRLAAIAEYRSLTVSIDAAKKRLPAWARGDGHQYVSDDGKPYGPRVGWPQIEDNKRGHVYFDYTTKKVVRVVRPSPSTIKGMFLILCEIEPDRRDVFRSDCRAEMKRLIARLRQKKDQKTALGITDMESKLSTCSTV